MLRRVAFARTDCRRCGPGLVASIRVRTACPPHRVAQGGRPSPDVHWRALHPVSTTHAKVVIQTWKVLEPMPPRDLAAADSGFDRTTNESLTPTRRVSQTSLAWVESTMDAPNRSTVLFTRIISGVAMMRRRTTFCAVIFGILSAACTQAESHGSAGSGGSSAGSSGSGGIGTGHVGAVGTRCRVAGDCDPGLECFGRFFKERGVCTRTCSTASDCGAGVAFVGGIIDYNSQPLPSRCVRACSTQPDCATLNSDCDSARASDPRYCF